MLAWPRCRSPLPARRDTAAPGRGQPAWPSAAAWEALGQRVDGVLRPIRSPLLPCVDAPDGPECQAVFRALKNPYFIGDDPALTQTCAWVDAWTTQLSAYAVAARDARHVAAAVDFARTHDLRLVVRGGGHSYLGSSNAPDSLMIWTRAMHDVALHDAFVPQGCDVAPVPAVSLGAGAIWMQAYAAVSTQGGRYVQGGGCVTVGVAGLVQGGGFGTYSKRFGTAAASLLEAEIVTADGAVRVVNAARDPDLFWALKGGGGGTFGVLTRLTLRTWELPEVFGHIATDIRATNDAVYRRLIGRFVAFYAEALCNPHWGEIAELRRGNRLIIAMNAQGLDVAAIQAVWQPFLDWVAAQDDLHATPPTLIAGAGRYRWDGAALERFAPGSVLHDDRPGAPVGNVFWAANLAEAGHVIHGFESLLLPAGLLRPERQDALVNALLEAGRHWTVELHFQKGLAGAPTPVIEAARDTPMNPAVTEAFALAIIAGEGPPAFPELRGHTPDVATARRNAAAIGRATAALREVAPGPGAYLAESSYFQPDWQRAYWGANYDRLLAVKRRYDPSGLFFTRHGVGSEDWSEDGFTRLT